MGSTLGKTAHAITLIVAVALGIIMTISCIATLFVSMLAGRDYGSDIFFKVVLCGTGMIFSTVLFICSCGVSGETKQKHLFATIAAILHILIFVSGLMDVVASIGGNGMGNMMIALETVAEILLIAVHMLFWFYQRESLPKTRMQRIFTTLICSSLAVYAVLILTNPITHLMFFVNEDGVLEYPGEVADYILFFILYASYVVYILFQKCSVHKKIAVMSFALFPIVNVVIEVVWTLIGARYGLFSTFYIFMLVAAYIVFFGDYIESKDIMLRQKAEIAEQSRRQTELQTALMLSQIRPHFLYNAITAIRNLCKSNPAEAYSSLGIFADYLRGNMDSLGGGRIITFEKELEHIKAYLTLEQLRFGDELKVEYDIRETDFSLPALSVQPIVENAVRHGATMNENGGKITISSVKTTDGVAVIVTDNGPGFDPNAEIDDGRSHIGIENVGKSLAASGCGEISIDSTKGVGTTVTILIKSGGGITNDYLAC